MFGTMEPWGALGLVLDRADDRREDRAARATRDYLRDYAADTKVAGLCRRDERRQIQRHDLTEYPPPTMPEMIFPMVPRSNCGDALPAPTPPSAPAIRLISTCSIRTFPFD